MTQLPQKPPTYEPLITNARRMRHEPTDAEKKIWSRLRNRSLNGYKFRRQHPFLIYILDFYCEDRRLVVELDGGQHLDEDQAAYDSMRTQALERQGMRVLRFGDDEALKWTDAVLSRILEELEASVTCAPPHPNPLPEGEGIRPRIRRGLEQ